MKKLYLGFATCLALFVGAGALIDAGGHIGLAWTMLIVASLASIAMVFVVVFTALAAVGAAMDVEKKAKRGPLQ